MRGDRLIPSAQDVYEGQFQNDKRHGFGILVRANGDRYEGNWADDMKEGPGVYHYVAKRQVRSVFGNYGHGNPANC